MTLQTTLLEIIYTSLIIFPSLFIYVKTKKLYDFSKYKGIRYFSNAFLFFTLAFLVRLVYFTSGNYQDSILSFLFYKNYLLILFEFLFLLPGFYFLMCLLHKHIIKLNKSKQYLILSSFILIFLFVSIIDYLFYTFLLMYIVNIIIFFFNSIISYKNYLKKKTLYGQIFSISMMLLLFAWTLNFATQNILQKLPVLRYYVYLINIIAVIIILVVVNKLTKDF
jgi:hypothetical protein